MASPNVMVVSRSLEVQQAFASQLAKSGLAPILATSGSEAEAILRSHCVSLIFCSDDLPENEVVTIVQQKSQGWNRVPAVVVSQRDDWERFISFLHRGALDCLRYPLKQIEIERVLDIVEIREARRATAIRNECR